MYFKIISEFQLFFGPSINFLKFRFIKILQFVFYSSSIIEIELIPKIDALLSSSFRLTSPIPSKLPVDKQIKSTRSPFPTKCLTLGVKNMHSSSGCAVTNKMSITIPVNSLSPSHMETSRLIKDKFSHIPKWKSSEFFAYYAIIAAAVYFTVKECIVISLPSHPVHQSYSHLLSKGWLFNLKIVKTK